MINHIGSVLIDGEHFIRASYDGQEVLFRAIAPIKGTVLHGFKRVLTYTNISNHMDWEHRDNRRCFIGMRENGGPWELVLWN